MNVMDCLKEDKWERQVTSRRYLHPPFEEELATMWIQLSHFWGDIYKKDARNIKRSTQILHERRILHGRALCRKRQILRSVVA